MRGLWHERHSPVDNKMARGLANKTHCREFQVFFNSNLSATPSSQNAHEDYSTDLRDPIDVSQVVYSVVTCLRHLSASLSLIDGTII